MADSVWPSQVAGLGTKNFSSWCVFGKLCFWMVRITYQILNECSTGKTTITWLAVAPTLEVIRRTMRALWMATPTPCLAVWTMLLASQGSIWSRYSCTHVAALCTNTAPSNNSVTVRRIHRCPSVCTMDAECADLNDDEWHAALKGTEWHHATGEEPLGTWRVPIWNLGRRWPRVPFACIHRCHSATVNGCPIYRMRLIWYILSHLLYMVHRWAL